MTCKKHKDKSDYDCQDCFNNIVSDMDEINYKTFKKIKTETKDDDESIEN